MQSGPPIAEIHHHLRTAQAKEKGREGDGNGERERKSGREEDRERTQVHTFFFHIEATAINFDNLKAPSKNKKHQKKKKIFRVAIKHTILKFLYTCSI
jgi:hypothetical protein